MDMSGLFDIFGIHTSRTITSFTFPYSSNQAHETHFFLDFIDFGLPYTCKQVLLSNNYLRTYEDKSMTFMSVINWEHWG